MKSLLSVFALLGAFAFSAAAADVNGKWTAEVQGRNGAQTMTMTFKTDGAKLSGAVSNPRGDSEISEGKVDGDNISFVVVRKMGDNEMKINYMGKVEGDSIKFTQEMNGGPNGPRKTEFVAKKAN